MLICNIVVTSGTRTTLNKNLIERLSVSRLGLRKLVEGRQSEQQLLSNI
jgi:hypothetical protein